MKGIFITFKAKRFLPLILVILLITSLSSTAFATLDSTYNCENRNHVECESTSQDTLIFVDGYGFMTIQELTSKLNAGLIAPHEFSQQLDNSQVSNLISRNWPWTDCTNILGHSWPVGYLKFLRVNHSAFCGIGNCTFVFVRIQDCQRTNCRMSQHIPENVLARC